jgi:hypothetical protein
MPPPEQIAIPLGELGHAVRQGGRLALQFRLHGIGPIGQHRRNVGADSLLVLQ